MYRLSFETVNAIDHPEAYNPRTDRADWPPEMVPEEWWHEVHRDTDDPWDQLEGLGKIRAEGELIRNIRLQELEPAKPGRTLEYDP